MQPIEQATLPKSNCRKSVKAIRFHLIQLPGRVLSRAGQLFVHLRDTHPSLEVLLVARHRILALAAASPT